MRRTRCSRTQSYDNGSIMETTRTIPWLSRAVIHPRVEGSPVDNIHSPISSRVEGITEEETDSSSLTDSISSPLSIISRLVFPPDLSSFNLAPLHSLQLICIHPPPYFVTPFPALPAVTHTPSSSSHSSRVYNINVFLLSQRILVSTCPGKNEEPSRPELIQSFGVRF